MPTKNTRVRRWGTPYSSAAAAPCAASTPAPSWRPRIRPGSVRFAEDRIPWTFSMSSTRGRINSASRSGTHKRRPYVGVVAHSRCRETLAGRACRKDVEGAAGAFRALRAPLPRGAPAQRSSTTAMSRPCAPLALHKRGVSDHSATRLSCQPSRVRATVHPLRRRDPLRSLAGTSVQPRSPGLGGGVPDLSILSATRPEKAHVIGERLKSRAFPQRNQPALRRVEKAAVTILEKYPLIV